MTNIFADILDFIAKTLNTIALAFLVVGFVNPFINREELEPWFASVSEDKLELVGQLNVFNPGVNVNWLLTSLAIYLTALVAVGIASGLRNSIKDS